MSKRTQRRAEQRRLNRDKHEQTGGAVKLTSEAQIAASRENATHSTGPTSEIGKAIVSQNCTVHGLNYNPNTFRVLACEDQAQYDAHKPTETTETLLVTAMAQHNWLLQGANRLQESCFNQETAAITDQKLFSLSPLRNNSRTGLP